VIDACRQAMPPPIAVAAAHQARCIRAYDAPLVHGA
jgi:hypothetical protein